ncbi:MAG: hypothetical protein MUF72_02755 [Elainella sp. Prado103]|jgi:hypothetical protein|nr:hypothetical protein [Elainella sp. Prado103]
MDLLNSFEQGYEEWGKQETQVSRKAKETKLKRREITKEITVKATVKANAAEAKSVMQTIE